MKCPLPGNVISKLLLVLLLAISTTTAVNAKEVISPEKFSGDIAEGYRAAQKAKDICSKLFCYCGCDLTDEHTSLLDCFTSMHGVDCAICQEEAIIASNMKEQGKTLAQIQKAIDDKFAGQYPWEEASPTFEKYLKTVRASDTNKVKSQTSNTKYNTKRGTLPKKAKGSCCGH